MHVSFIHGIHPTAHRIPAIGTIRPIPHTGDPIGIPWRFLRFSERTEMAELLRLLAIVIVWCSPALSSVFRLRIPGRAGMLPAVVHAAPPAAVYAR